jgi:dissimilatory sulfite reductase (desulfoviridin) alpha/beta subunit
LSANSSRRVGYRLCGSCNPYIDTREALSRIEGALPGVSLVYWEEGSFDTLLIISGCPRDCATRPEGDFKLVVARPQFPGDIDGAVRSAVRELG